MGGFGREQVDISGNRWKCKHCGESFEGSIRNHLSGQGNDIAACVAVPREIREVALMITPMKRRLGEDNPIEKTIRNTGNVVIRGDNVPGDAFRNPSPSSSNPSMAALLQSPTGPSLTETSVPRDAFTNPTPSNPSIIETNVLGGGIFSANTTDLPPFSSNILSTTTMATPDNDSFDALVRFFMCMKNTNVIKDPRFRVLLERACQGGGQSLPGGFYSLENSLSNIQTEVRHYMTMVKESWKTTGCTLMVFNPDLIKQKLIAFTDGKCVLGFYCPKGVIFVEAHHSSVLQEGIPTVMKRHDPKLNYHGVKHQIFHGKDMSTCCELHCEERLLTSGTVLSCYNIQQISCSRSIIHKMCVDICKKSKWAQSLISKAEEIHQWIASSHYGFWYYNILKEKARRGDTSVDFQGFAYGKHADPLNRFLSVMLLEIELKIKLIHLCRQKIITGDDQAKIQATLKDSKFWDDGRELKQALTLVLKISDLMDTLVPTAGYLQMAMDKVKRVIFSKDRRHPMQEDSFWHDLRACLSPKKTAANITCQEAIAYLNPAYFLEANSAEKGCFFSAIKHTLGNLVREEERKEFDVQLQFYFDQCSNMFANIADQLHNHHPVKLWEQYGQGLPLLQKFAIRMLSQPTSCLCNQVKKHMFQLEGADDYVYRLNVRMMEEFRNLGDDIWKPIDLKEIDLLIDSDDEYDNW